MIATPMILVLFPLISPNKVQFVQNNCRKQKLLIFLELFLCKPIHWLWWLLVEVSLGFL